MIEAAEREGRIKPGATLVEATAGNTGLGLALVAARKGYRLLLVIPDKMSQEKIFHLKAMGAEVVMTRSDVVKGHPDYYQDMAARIARETPGAFYINQFTNPANPQAHEETTAPEIWEQMQHRLDAVVCGVGTGGTLTGLSRFFAQVAPARGDRAGRPAGLDAGRLREDRRDQVPPRSWLVEGIGEDFIPDVCDLSRVSTLTPSRTPRRSRPAGRCCNRKAFWRAPPAARCWRRRCATAGSRPRPKRVVSLVCDSGNKYLSKVYNDYWMLDQGFLQRERFGDLRDLIARRALGEGRRHRQCRRNRACGLRAHEAVRYVPAAGHATTAGSSASSTRRTSS